MTEESRLALRLKRLKDEIKNAQSQLNLHRGYKSDSMEEDIDDEEPQSILDILQSKYPILADIVDNVLSGNKEYSEQTIFLGNTIHSLSPKIHKLLNKEIGFPSDYICKKNYNEEFNEIIEAYGNISQIGTIIQRWKKNNRIKQSQKISACLSCDALFFHPEITVNADNEITGMDLPPEQYQKLPDNFGKLLISEPALFENFLLVNNKHIIRSGFVFQIQPYDPQYKTFTVFIKQATNGKANEEIIQILKLIKKESKNKNITILSFAFDGDKAYQYLHQSYFDSYFKTVSKTFCLVFFEKVNCQRVSCDMLHLFKRIRYRLLTSVIHAGFDPNNDYISISVIKEILKLPSIVFNNSSITKMNDRLPLLLFSPENFLKLLNAGEFVAAAYWYPDSLIIITFTQQNLTYDQQFFFLECSFWFFVLIKVSEKNTNITKKLNQKKSKVNLNVRFYTDNMLIEICNSLHCHMSLMGFIENYCFDRNTSMPLEHKFGLARVRSHDINTLRMFIKTVADIENLQQTLDEITSAIQVEGRMKSFGLIVSKERGTFVGNSRERDINYYSPFQIASAILHKANFEVNVEYDDDHVLKHLMSIISCIISFHESSIKKVTLSKLTLGVSGGTRSKSLIRNQHQHSTPWCPDKKKKKGKCEMDKEEILSFFETYYKREPELCELQVLVYMISENDDHCPEIPNSENVDDYYSWFSKHLLEYQVLIHSILIQSNS